MSGLNKDEIIRMADEAMYLNLPIANRNFELQELIKFAELVAAAEREACAKVVSDVLYGQDGCGKAIEAIRARGNNAT
jgi:hypothetical protein